MGSCPKGRRQPPSTRAAAHLVDEVEELRLQPDLARAVERRSVGEPAVARVHLHRLRPDVGEDLRRRRRRRPGGREEGWWWWWWCGW